MLFLVYFVRNISIYGWSDGFMKKFLTGLTVIAVLSSAFSACVGVFFTDAGTERTVENIYGQQVVLYGNGIYADNSLMKAGATKGMDLVVLLAGLMLLAVILFFRDKKAGMLLQTGLLSIILYASVCLIMGVTMNRLFLLYVLQFGSSLFAFLLSLQAVAAEEVYQESLYAKHLVGTGVFLIAGGCSTFIWLTFLLPVVITGQPMETIEIYTTEPAFALDLAIVLPSALYSGIMLLKKEKIGYKMAPVLLTLLTGVGVCVIFQTIFQRSLGVVLSVGQMIGLVASFVVLGAIAAVLDLRLLKYAKQTS